MNMPGNPYGIESLWGQSDAVIKCVAVLLLAMSIASWLIIAVRAIGLMRLRRAVRAQAAFWHERTFEEGVRVLATAGRGNPFLHLVVEGRAAVAHHTERQCDLHGQLSLAEWLTASLRNALDECAERLQVGLGLLASVGSTAPFVGLFGTVWGIYHALVKIGVSGQAGIDKVAGPVGEALIMTAFGLVVAIPAVLGYNALSRGNKGVLGKLNRFAHQLHAYFLTGAPPARVRGPVALHPIHPLTRATAGAEAG